MTASTSTETNRLANDIRTWAECDILKNIYRSLFSLKNGNMVLAILSANIGL